MYSTTKVKAIIQTKKLKKGFFLYLKTVLV